MMDKAEKLQKIREMQNPLLKTNRELADLKKVVDNAKETMVPHKGVDYFTEEEVSSMCEYIQSQIHDGEQGIQGIPGESIVGPKGEKGDTVIGPAGKDGRNGIDADVEAVIKSVLKRIPKPADGKSPVVVDIIARVKEELGMPEMDKVMMKDDLVAFLKKGGFRGGGASFLSQLLDVQIGSQTNGQALIWDSTLQKWVPMTIAPAVSQFYAEPVINASNNDVIYQTGSNPVPDFIFDNNNSFVMTLVAI